MQYWDFYLDRQLSYLHQFIDWTGSRPLEVLKLHTKDINFDRGNYTKHDIESGKILPQPMNGKIRVVLLEQYCWQPMGVYAD